MSKTAEIHKPIEGELDCLFEIRKNKNEELEELKRDNERLRKMVQQIYEAFKRKALKYIVNSKMDTEDLNLFKEIFSSYLK